METPQIVRSLGFGKRFNVEDRVAQKNQQLVTNKEAFDIIYDNHRDYYRDKTFTIIDKNFENTEKYLLDGFRKSLDKTLSFDKNLKHVDEVKIPRDLGVDFNDKPSIHPGGVMTALNYENIQTDKNVKKIRADPYGAIFGGN